MFRSVIFKKHIFLNVHITCLALFSFCSFSMFLTESWLAHSLMLSHLICTAFFFYHECKIQWPCVWLRDWTSLSIFWLFVMFSSFYDLNSEMNAWHMYIFYLQDSLPAHDNIENEIVSWLKIMIQQKFDEIMNNFFLTTF